MAFATVAGLALSALAVRPVATAVPLIIAGAGLGALAASDRVASRPLWAIAFAALIAVANGAAEGSSSRTACVASLEGGMPVLVTGTLADRVPAIRAPRDAGGSEGGGARRGGARTGGRAAARVSGAVVYAEGRSCAIDVVRLTLSRTDEARDVGATVFVTGTWRRTGHSWWPRASTRYGYVSVTAVEPLTSERPATSVLSRIRGALASRLDERMRTDELAGIAKALLLADRTTLDREIRQRFVDAGVVHLLAISGLHVGMIAGGVVWVLGLFDRGRRRWIRAAVGVSVYVILIGAPPAATRAGLVFWGHAYCRWRDRPASIADLAGLAALIAVATDPLILLDPGFQLSFAGFAGVLIGHRVGERAVAVVKRRVTRSNSLLDALYRLGSSLVASAGAFVFTAPIGAIYFDRVIAASIPASVASTAVVALAIPSVAAAAVLPGPAGDLAGDAASALLTVLTAIAGVFAGIPLRWHAVGNSGWWMLTFAVVLMAAALARRTARPGFVVLMGLLASVIVARRGVRRFAGQGTPLLCTLDVGQGDAAVLRTGAGRWLVFDAGPGTSVLDGRELSDADRRLGAWMGDSGRDVIAPFLASYGAREIELFALSHPHLDHFGGIGTLFERFRIRHVLDPGVTEPSSAYLALLERVEAERSVWVRGAAGDVIRIDDATLTVLWPKEEGGEGANETSLSFRLDVGGFSYVNTGDAPVETEEAILHGSSGRDATGPRPEIIGPIDLLKLGHHGSKTSSAVAWLKALRPELAVMSLGRDNRYGHPHVETLTRLDSAGVRRVWRTDRDGTLCIAIEPEGWRIVDG